MPTVKDARRALQSLLERFGKELCEEERRACLRLVNQISPLDPVELEEVAALLQTVTPEAASTSPNDPARIAQELRGLLQNDAAFAQRARELATQRGVTKAVLAEVYRRLYRRQGGVRPTAAKGELIQLLIDERNILKRHGTLEALAAR